MFKSFERERKGVLLCLRVLKERERDASGGCFCVVEHNIPHLTVMHSTLARENLS